MNIMDDLIQVYMSRFINRVDAWGRQLPKRDGSGVYYHHYKPDMDTKDGKYTFEPVSAGLVRRMLAGYVTCSWAALDTEHCCRWLCWDSDNDNGEIERIQSVLSRWDFATIRAAVRPGRGGHLYLLMDGCVPAPFARRFAKEVFAHAGVKQDPSGKNGVEFYPKYDRGYSQVRAPLSIHRKPEANNCRNWFEGPDQDVEAQLRWLAEQPLNKASGVASIAQRLFAQDRLRQPKKRSRPRAFSTTDKGECINALDVIPASERKLSGSGWYQTQCPRCAEDGRDRSKSNLGISPDGFGWKCHAGHTFEEVRHAFLRLAPIAS